ncbi:MAG: hypothetical protein Fur0044_40960 [Anaerolineae bacterium]|nr:hypothetical protein [Anaerolineales bacterium]
MSTTQNPMELWLRLMSDAMRGTADAQEAIRTLGEIPTTPDQLTRWMTRFMPLMAGQTPGPEMMGDWLEDAWKMMGVVPRYRYLELLERHELLRQRLEEAEKTIQKLRKTSSGNKMPEQEVQQILNLWEGMLQETLSMQADWMRTWTKTEATEAKGETKNSTSEDAGLSSNEENEE